MTSAIRSLSPIIILLCSNFLFAQHLSVANGIVVHDEQSRECIEVQFSEPGPKKVKAAYKDWIEGNYNAKVDGFGFLKNKDVLIAEKAGISTISDHKMNLYAKIVDNGDIIVMSVFGSLGYDFQINVKDYPKEFAAMRTMTYNFLKDFLPIYYKEKLEESTQVISSIQDDKEDARDDIEKNKKEIESLKNENAKLSNEIKKYEQKLNNAERRLKEYKQVSEEVSNRLKNEK